MNEQKGFFTQLGQLIDRSWVERRTVADEQKPAGCPARMRWLARQMLPNIGTLLLVAVLLVTQNAWARPLQSIANAPGPSATTVNYQGRLANSGGNPLTGTYGMTFALYDAATGSNLMWGPESHTAVQVSNGLFSVGLGSQTSGGIPTNVWNGDRYLEITVGSETLSPRELIRSVPVAGMALTVPDRAIKSRNAQLTVGRVAADIPPNGYLVLTSDLQDVPGTSFTLTPETDLAYLIYVTADLDVVDTLAGAALFVDGVLQPSAAIFAGYGSGGERGTVSQVYQVNLSAGTHTLGLKANRFSTGTRALIWATHTTITYFAVSQ